MSGNSSSVFDAASMEMQLQGERGLQELNQQSSSSGPQRGVGLEERPVDSSPAIPSSPVGGRGMEEVVGNVLTEVGSGRGRGRPREAGWRYGGGCADTREASQAWMAATTGD